MSKTTYTVESLTQTEIVPEVTVSDETVILGEKACQYNGQQVTLAEVVIPLQQRAVRCYNACWLVRVKETNGISILVDEVLWDGVDEAYNFRRDDCPYEPLCLIAEVSLEANAPTSEAAVTVYEQRKAN